MQVQVASMLASPPEGAKEACLIIWRSLKPLNIEEMLKFWTLIDKNSSMMDPDNALYAEWDEYGKKRFGMRHRSTGTRHGIVRVVEPNGNVYEATYKQGKMHGLYRWITENEIRLQLSFEGVGRALIHFSPDFKELARNDPMGLFNGLQALDFKND